MLDVQLPFTASEFLAQNTRMSARVFLDTFEPGVLELMLDVDVALAEDTERAHKVAKSVGHARNELGLYHRLIWEIVYPR